MMREGILSLDKFRIAETETFQKKIQSRTCRNLYRKITEYVYPLLRENPYFGPNIKKLKGKYRDLYRFRIGEYRLFYKIEESMIVVFIITIEKRKDAYR